MAFPSNHVYPPDLRAWRLEGHRLAAGERVEITQYEQGEDRQREIRSTTFWPAAVSTVLVGEEFDRFSRWFEVDLQGGTQLFDTQVASMAGNYAQWWQAMFVGPYRVESLNSGVYVITAELILLDGPYDENNLPAGSSPGDPPRVARGIYARGDFDSDGWAQFGVGGIFGRGDFDSDGWAIFDNGIYARSDHESEGWAIFGSFFLLLESDPSVLSLEGGFSLITEDGDALLIDDGSPSRFLTETDDRIYLEP
jgi:hypothetical protein